MLRRIRWSMVAGAALLLLVVAQAVPYGRQHSNPPVVMEPAWDSPATRELAVRACFDCHSNETVWPAYASLAPMSWLVQHDVDEGREMLNFSEWQRPQEEAGEAAEVIEQGEMPPAMYVLMHPGARLSPDSQAQLVRGLTSTLGRAPEAPAP